MLQEVNTRVSQQQRQNKSKRLRIEPYLLMLIGPGKKAEMPKIEDQILKLMKIKETIKG